VCRSNLRQWCIGLRMYVEDFKVYPLCDVWPAGTNATQTIVWHNQLEGYTGAKWCNWDPFNGPHPTGIQVCPSYSRLGGDFDAHHVGSYGYNANGFIRSSRAGGLSGEGIWTNTPPPRPTIADYRLVRDTEVVCPADMIAIADAHVKDLGGGWPRFFGHWRLDSFDSDTNFELGLNNPPGSDQDAGWVRKRHGGRWNVVFCDAHVESLKTRSLFDPSQDTVVQRWNRDHLP